MRSLMIVLALAGSLVSVACTFGGDPSAPWEFTVADPMLCDELQPWRPLGRRLGPTGTDDDRQAVAERLEAMIPTPESEISDDYLIASDAARRLRDDPDSSVSPSEAKAVSNLDRWLADCPS